VVSSVRVNFLLFSTRTSTLYISEQVWYYIVLLKSNSIFSDSYVHFLATISYIVTYSATSHVVILNTTAVSNGFVTIYLHGGLIIVFLAVGLQLYANKNVI
jgi:hypothetical protein